MPIRIPLLYLLSQQFQHEEVRQEKKEIEKILNSEFKPQSDFADNLRGLSVEAIYLSRETAIKIITMNSNASLTSIKFSARVLYYSTGEIADEQFDLPITTSDRSKETSTILGLSNCYLISCQLDPTQVTRYGQCYAQAVLNNRKNGKDVCTLLSGYVESVHSLATGLKSDTSEKSVDLSRGYLRIVVGTNPAAGVEVSETVPTNATWELLGLFVQLVTSSTVVDRLLRLSFYDGSNTFQSIEAPFVHPQSTTYYYNFGRKLGFQQPSPLGDNPSIGLPDISLMQGWQINTSTIFLQAGDNFAAPILYVKEKIEE